MNNRILCVIVLSILFVCLLSFSICFADTQASVTAPNNTTVNSASGSNTASVGSSNMDFNKGAQNVLNLVRILLPFAMIAAFFMGLFTKQRGIGFALGAIVLAAVLMFLSDPDTLKTFGHAVTVFLTGLTK